MKPQVTSSHTNGNGDDPEYDAFLARIQARFLRNTEHGVLPLFTTDTESLYARYLDSFGPAPTEGEPVTPLRQHHTCHACRRFIETFGGLVTVGADGIVASAVWNEEDAPDLYKPAVAAMERAARRARITGVFLSSDRLWGTPKTGEWSHLSLTPAQPLYTRVTLTAEQAMAERREDFKNVMRALSEFTLPQLETAVTLLKTDSLYRSEKILGAAVWLRDLHLAHAAVRGEAARNVVWRAVATAPAGFCHPRSGMIGTLLEDLAAGMSFEAVSKRFSEKMHPLSYQRPQVAPAAGTIAQAEKVVEQLKAAGSLARRFARLDEVRALWRPNPPKEATASQGVFGHLLPKNDPAQVSLSIPAQKITWEKFSRTVLPTAEEIDARTPAYDHYVGLVTAVNADAPPILQWDREDARNPVSWYHWAGGASARQFGLIGGSWTPVDAVALKPSMWNGGHEHQGRGVVFVLRGARETRNPCLCLFPEILKADFHGIRSVIEAYSRKGELAGMHEPHAAGIMAFGTSDARIRVRVKSAGTVLEYDIDRWD